jgi:hypothetical protein
MQEVNFEDYEGFKFDFGRDDEIDEYFIVNDNNCGIKN